MIETDIFDALETTAEIMKVEFSVNLAQLPEKKEQTVCQTQNRTVHSTQYPNVPAPHKILIFLFDLFFNLNSVGRNLLCLI